MAFTAETTEIKEESYENLDEGMTLVTRGVRKMLRQRRHIPQQDFKNNDFKRNNDHCYYFGEPWHIKKLSKAEEKKQSKKWRSKNP